MSELLLNDMKQGSLEWHEHHGLRSKILEDQQAHLVGTETRFARVKCGQR